MANEGTRRTEKQGRTRGSAASHNPAEAARRELVEWCQAHRIPVPAEHRSQSSDR
jgi:hypothetical protein